MPLTRLATAPRRELLPATIAVDRDTSPQRRSLATVAVVSATSLVNAPRLPRTTAPLAARSVTSAAVSVTSRETAPRVVATVASVVAMAVVSRPATPVAVLDTWPATAPRDRSATTAERSATFPATALQRPRVSGFATTASNPATSRAPAPTTKRVGIHRSFVFIKPSFCALNQGTGIFIRPVLFVTI
ncbi:hypothetical protein BJX61DRAFT_247357 [Aspergillus egyptiacus]|nr:hypothetical protein BJX61DRAFT_247357 [Aspergillus egyptiacus]